ncbi:hypothetical protein V6N13_047020 [Hibiscus sabdariffa]
MNSKPVLKTLYPMEAEASLVYTRKLFRIFQDELVHAQEYVANRVDVNDGLKAYKVHVFNQEKPMHALVIFIKKKIFSLPSQYIILRWTKDEKKNGNPQIMHNKIVDKVSESSTLWINSVMLHSLGLSEKATRSDKHYNFAICGITKLCEELDNLAIDPIDEGKKSSSIDDSKMLEGRSVLHNGIALRDPIRDHQRASSFIKEKM